MSLRSSCLVNNPVDGVRRAPAGPGLWPGPPCQARWAGSGLQGRRRAGGASRTSGMRSTVRLEGPARTMRGRPGACLQASGALLLPRRLDSCHPLGRGRRVRAREATAQRLGLDTADSAGTIVQRGDDTGPAHYEGVTVRGRQFKARFSSMFAGCCWWRSWAVDDSSGGISRAHTHRDALARQLGHP